MTVKHTQGKLKGEVNINDLTIKHPRYTLGIKNKSIFHTTFENSRLNANRVMLCWNSHDALLEACKKIRKHEKGCKKRNIGYDITVDEIVKAALNRVEKGK